jgi:hypothetical protein
MSSTYKIVAPQLGQLQNAVTASYLLGNAATDNISITPNNPYGGIIQFNNSISVPNVYGTASLASGLLPLTYFITASNAINSQTAIVSNSTNFLNYSPGQNNGTASYAVNAAVVKTGLVFLPVPVIIAYSGTTGSGAFISECFPSGNFAGATVVGSPSSAAAGTWNATANAGVPSNVTGLIIQGAHSDAQNGGTFGVIYISNTSISTQRLLITGGQGGGSGAGISNAEGIFPINGDGTIYWSRINSNFNGGWVVGLVGYFI